jgi:hypothetical protein
LVEFPIPGKNDTAHVVFDAFAIMRLVPKEGVAFELFGAFEKGHQIQPFKPGTALK